MKPTLIKDFISADLARTIATLFFLCDDVPHYLYKEAGQDGKDSSRGLTWNKHSPLWGDALLLGMQDKVQLLTNGLSLIPTYSFVRLYEDGSELLPHFDKAACEYSVSVCLASQLNKPNALIIEQQDDVSEIYLAPGDGVLYTGGTCRHWRGLIDGWLLTLILHYVDTNGDFRDLAYDERPGTRVLFESVRGRLGFSLGGGA